MESFNGRLPDELLSSEIFDTLAEGRHLIDRWRLFHNHRRIERALGKLTPAVFAAAPPRTQVASILHQLSSGVER